MLLVSIESIIQEQQKICQGLIYLSMGIAKADEFEGMEEARFKENST